MNINPKKLVKPRNAQQRQNLENKCKESRKQRKLSNQSRHMLKTTCLNYQNNKKHRIKSEIVSKASYK
jgi:hypothetical protein